MNHLELEKQMFRGMETIYELAEIEAFLDIKINSVEVEAFLDI